MYTIYTLIIKKILAQNGKAYNMTDLRMVT